MFDPELISITPPSNPTERYRWYLCLETNGLSWSCKETTKDAALSYMGNAKSVAVPIPKWVPNIIDKSIIHNALSPRVRIVQEFKKTDQ